MTFIKILAVHCENLRKQICYGQNEETLNDKTYAIYCNGFVQRISRQRLYKHDDYATITKAMVSVP
jgi:hypothetical protein